MIKNVWIVTCWFRDFENSGYTSPSEEFHADTYAEAEQMKNELMEHPEYESVEISEASEEREFYDR